MIYFVYVTLGKVPVLPERISAMTPRELWQHIMFYEDFDRMPVVHWETLPETRDRWLQF